MSLFALHHGDCLEVLRGMESNSVDAIVTDPPYGLSREPDMAEVLRHWLNGDDYQHRGGGFMGKAWDSFVPGPAIWRECLRVLKPGGHLLAFFGTRTQDIGTLAIRLAGFEIRDSIAWVYGSGFPKSLDVSKAVDKAAGAEREVVGPATPATESARQWQGWGTALKPALEPITVARKPLIGTVAANVLAHGTGALNIDGCRVAHDGTGTWGDNQNPDRHASSLGYMGGEVGRVSQRHDAGRWPANLIHDGSEEVVAQFPANAGAAAPVRGTEASAASVGRVTGEREHVPGAFHAGTGSAARFFYCAKAARKDRNEGCEGFEQKMPKAANGAENAVSANRGIRSGPRENHHPTVKPTDLMRYLCRLVTPPGGVVLDPFAGSGSTGKGAILEGFRFIGIERESEYVAIAEARISAALPVAQDATPVAEEAQNELFAGVL